MPLRQFHPAVINWFESSFEGATEIQKKAWPEIKKHRNTLISAPTGSGKTLAAFLATIDDLVRQDITGNLMPGTQVVYVSPLKALSNDIQKNLQVPLRGITQELKKQGIPEINIKVMVRTGDTAQSERTAMIKNPPHILVTTPESLYLLLTSVNGRKMLSTVHTAIVDEIHALVGNKRGAHLALSMERLEALTARKLVRIGLSATQKPIEQVAHFLTGWDAKYEQAANCTIINAGHSRKLDLALELPNSPLTAIMANEVWGELYDKIENLINQHKTTLIFVNTRRLAERMAHHLTERLGEKIITAHHGSMSKDHRLDAEQRLKAGNLKALVATASLELGIDIGSVDLVIQIGSPKSIAAFLQRVGRSGHSVKGTPKGRLFPLSRDELIECTALLDAVRRGELDKIIMPEKPLDILAQQIVAEVASRDYTVEDLYRQMKKAYPYRELSKKDFQAIIQMLADGFTTRRGRRSAYLHYDMVNERLKARKGARLTALVSGGAIPDNFDFDVMLEPQNIFVGTLNEDFAIESLPGDIFQLGNNSWRILRVENGKVRVEDAGGLPPTIPFWLGEAPGRTIELSNSVSRLRETVSEKLGDVTNLKPLDEYKEGEEIDDSYKASALDWLENEVGIDTVAADQVATYLAAGKAALGVLPSQDNLVMERFFDEAGDMHLVIHSPFGSRMNRAWGLSLRKRFCKKFNFELQAAATEDAIILSLGSTHSFPLEEVFHYLHPEKVRGILIQALLDAPMFEVRWRWNASRALAILRRNAGKKVPPQIQRSQSEDLIALVFPDQLACFENIQGEREVPEHPLVDQTIHDCLYEAMDIEQLEYLLSRIKEKKVNLISKDLREPSPFSREILNANPYAFLDDAPAEERRTNAVISRRWLDPSEVKDLAQLDLEAIHSVKSEAWPQAQNAEELHDALVLFGFLTEEEGKHEGWEFFFQELINDKRATVLKLENDQNLWVAIERLPQIKPAYPDAVLSPILVVPQRISDTFTQPENALMELVRGRLEALGPVQAQELADSMCKPLHEIETALTLLENDGFVFRGHFTPELEVQEWCERRLLARIHRYTLKKLRKEIEPVSSSDYMRFLFAWHNLEPGTQPEGPKALQKVLEQLEGFEAQAASWESDLLPARLHNYDFGWLDGSCLSGKTVWGRFRPYINSNGKQKSTSPIKTTPVTLVTRNNVPLWKHLSVTSNDNSKETRLSDQANMVLEYLLKRGASFYHDIVENTGLMHVQVEHAMSELVTHGLLTSDSYTGLRALLVPNKYNSERRRLRGKVAFTMEEAGRWSLIQPDGNREIDKKGRKKYLEAVAGILLKRYGVVIRKLADRENLTPPWWELVRVLRLMEARGEVRGGRFVEGVYGEQFALPEAVAQLRRLRKELKKGNLISISAADPLNLTGIITPEKRIPSVFSNRILYRDGTPVAVKEGKEVKFLLKLDESEKWSLKKALIQRNVSPKLRAYLGKGII